MLEERHAQHALLVGLLEFVLCRRRRWRGWCTAALCHRLLSRSRSRGCNCFLVGIIRIRVVVSAVFFVMWRVARLDMCVRRAKLRLTGLRVIARRGRLLGFVLIRLV